MAVTKRTFAEITSLNTYKTLIIIEDDYPIIPKTRHVGSSAADVYGMREEQDAPTTPYAHPHLDPRGQLKHTLPADASRKLSAAVANITNVTVSIIPEPEIHNISTLMVVKDTANPFKDVHNIVKSIDRSNALRKSWYDPKTIARDVLIATGRHPSQRSLNAHLEPLKERFPTINNSADLSTFRWDVVDPGGLVVGPASMPALHDESIPKENESISPSVLKSKPLKLNLPVGRGQQPSRGRGSFHSSRGAVRPLSQDTTPPQPSSLRYSSTINSSFAVVIPSVLPADIAATIIPTPPSPAGDSRMDTLDDMKALIVKRRPGRPPRPKEISTASSDPSIIQPKRRGRPPMAETLAKRAKNKPPLPPPKFVPFLCEWKSCSAELHNLETLRKHVHTFHIRTQPWASFICQWAKCGMAQQTREFDGIEDLKEHVESSHLIPFAWHMGDGPRGSTLDGSESDASAYLSDANGRPVTPSIAGQKVEYGSAIVNNARRIAKQASQEASRHGLPPPKRRGRPPKDAKRREGNKDLIQDDSHEELLKPQQALAMS